MTRSESNAANMPPTILGPHWSDAYMQEAAGRMDEPFNRFAGLQAMARLAVRMAPALDDRYELIVGEGRSAVWPADVFGWLVDNSRRARGLSAVCTGNIDGNNGDPLVVSSDEPFVQTDTDARALLLTEYVNIGASIFAAYGCLTAFRPPGSVDIATVGISSLRSDSGRPSWLAKGSEFYAVPQTHIGVFHALTGPGFRNAIRPEQYAGNLEIAGMALQAVLDEARVRGESAV